MVSVATCVVSIWIVLTGAPLRYVRVLRLGWSRGAGDFGTVLTYADLPKVPAGGRTTGYRRSVRGVEIGVRTVRFVFGIINGAGSEGSASIRGVRAGRIHRSPTSPGRSTSMRHGCYTGSAHRAPRDRIFWGVERREKMYWISGMDLGNGMLDAEQFETLEAALKRACEIEKTGAIVELFQDDTPAPIMDFTQVSAWCRANSQQGD